MIPPTANKSTFYSPLVVRTAWTWAHKQVSTADELIIIGYSFPETDSSARRFIQSALSQTTTVTCVDKNPATQSRIEEIIGRPVKKFNSLHDYIDSACGKFAYYCFATDSSGQLTPLRAQIEQTTVEWGKQVPMRVNPFLKPLAPDRYFHSSVGPSATILKPEHSVEVTFKVYIPQGQLGEPLWHHFNGMVDSGTLSPSR